MTCTQSFKNPILKLKCWMLDSNVDLFMLAKVIHSMWNKHVLAVSWTEQLNKRKISIGELSVLKQGALCCICITQVSFHSGIPPWHWEGETKAQQRQILLTGVSSITAVQSLRSFCFQMPEVKLHFSLPELKMWIKKICVQKTHKYLAPL